MTENSKRNLATRKDENEPMREHHVFYNICICAGI
jgi:hypothetical protein